MLRQYGASLAEEVGSTGVEYADVIGFARALDWPEPRAPQGPHLSVGIAARLSRAVRVGWGAAVTINTFVQLAWTLIGSSRAQRTERLE
jgi:hypothetical protein